MSKRQKLFEKWNSYFICISTSLPTITAIRRWWWRWWDIRFKHVIWTSCFGLCFIKWVRGRIIRRWWSCGCNIGLEWINLSGRNGICIPWSWRSIIILLIETSSRSRSDISVWKKKTLKKSDTQMVNNTLYSFVCM